LNPLDHERAHMFIYNNIFYSFNLDGREYYKHLGGDRAAHTCANNDLKGVTAFNTSDIEGLHTLLTAIIDHRGYRLVAQSIIPGILHREETSRVLYGSLDHGNSIVSDPEFHKLILQVARKLHFAEHTVVDEKGNEVTLSSPIESKGIMGTDGRRYLLDLVRVTPQDSNYLENKVAILRPELIFAYVEYLREKSRTELETKGKEEKEKQREKAGEKVEEKEKKNVSRKKLKLRKKEI